MMLFMLATDDTLPLLHQAMRDEFRKGGSYGSMVLTFAGLAGLVLLVHVLQKWYDRSHGPKEDASNPAMLFRKLLTKLELPPGAQQLLTDLARDRKIKNPTALLISSQLFDTYTSQWQGEHSNDDQSVQIAKIRTRLFGGGRA